MAGMFWTSISLRSTVTIPFPRCGRGEPLYIFKFLLLDRRRPWRRRIYFMAKLIFITGGARSGKSRYAQELALQHSDSPVYVATARIWDEDFRQRIERHRQDRD